ncbi:ribonuclease T2 [Roseivivax halodurans JCM 10272]|uniref:Ribonuclease T2 n=1 Tax=Roseivivax halodurans JCM 10272 TaxID=1449350 RepID=X7EM00_9RHOB|nr:ribonuclease T2 [Roseivivax halodurans]ETX16193.1 ribonuclease T2 [Roseivivax halodurans JCM 10272]
MRIAAALMMALTGFGGPGAAEGERAGDFDYWVLALSWSPTWCALTGEARGARQCERPLGWILHGLWPQYETGWPSYCPTEAAPPRPGAARAMAEVMGSASLATYQWEKHGVCSGLPGDAYLETARAAYRAVERPDVLRRLTEPVRLPASVIEDAFLEANPGLEADMITITCRSGRIQEARLCLTRDMQPRRCGADVIGDCSARDALLDPIR